MDGGDADGGGANWGGEEGATGGREESGAEG